MKKFYGIVLSLCLSFAVLGGCGAPKYGAVLYDRANEYFNEIFLNENLTTNAQNEWMSADDSYPVSVTHLIKTEQAFTQTAVSFPSEIDFEKKMVCIYFFTCIYMGRPYKLKEISLSGNSIEIKIKSVRPFSLAPTADASSPMQRCFLIVLDRMDVETVAFTVSD